MKGVGVAIQQKPRANFEFGKKKVPRVATGDDVTLVVKGKVTSFSESEWGNNLGIDIKSIDVAPKKDSGMTGDIRRMRESRKM